MKIGEVNLPSRENFMKYYRVQQSGRYNMIMDATKAIESSGLSRDEYFDVIKNYEECYMKYIQGIDLNQIKDKNKVYNFSSRIEKIFNK